jgi:hypothetical protein
LAAAKSHAFPPAPRISSFLHTADQQIKPCSYVLVAILRFRLKIWNVIVPEYHFRDLSGLLSGPDILEETVTLSEAVQGVIGLTLGADEAGQSVNLVLAGVATVLVDLADGDLHGGVVLGLDDAVGGAALAWDETMRENLVSIPFLLQVCMLGVVVFIGFEGSMRANSVL